MDDKRLNTVTQLYVFIQDRDAVIIELFFFFLNTYILALVALPPHSTTGWSYAVRLVLQLLVTLLNLFALTRRSRRIRLASSVANAAIMSLISASLFHSNNPNVGTYILLATLAVFVCWKISIRQR